MKLCKILAVLLTLTLTIGCITSVSNKSIVTERSYRMEKVLNVSDGRVRIQLAVNENNGMAGGQTFWVDINKISTVVNEDLGGTYIYIRGRDGGNENIDLSQIYKATIVVRTSKQKANWDNFLAEQKDLLYGLRDVYPPEVSR